MSIENLDDLNMNMDTKHPLEATKSWDLYVESTRRAGRPPPQKGRRALKSKHDKKKKEEELADDDLFQHPDYDQETGNIEIVHEPYKGKIPKADGSTMHGMMIDAGSVS